MRTLVIDTALGACTVGLFQEGRALAVRSEEMARGHSERLGGFARDVSAGVGGFAGVDRIGVTVGPGSFTGLRVGMAFALGLGAALERPVVGVSTLQALAASTEDPLTPLLAVIDARRGEVYLQAYLAGAPLGPPEAMAVATARERFTPGPHTWRGIGNGAHLVLGTSAVVGPDNPSAAALDALTRRLDPDAHPARPLYLRAPDAVPPTRLPGQARAATVSVAP